MFPYTWAIAAIVGALWLRYCLQRKKPRLDFPVVGESGKADYSDAILEGYRKVYHLETPYSTEYTS